MARFTVNRTVDRLAVGGFEFSILQPGTTYSCPDELFAKLKEVVQQTPGRTVTKVTDSQGLSVTGSRSGGTALANLLTVLNTAGVIVNNSTT